MKVIDPEYHSDLTVINDILREESIIFIKPGNYIINKTIKIEKDNVQIRGLTENPDDVHIVQNDLSQDCLYISAKNVTINGISFHVDKNVEKTCISLASCNWCNISNCCFFGSNKYFTVFFAGPKHLIQGQNTIDSYLSGDLDCHNIFDNNMVHSYWDGDTISFSLQRYSCFRNNTLVGCKAAIYMTRDCMITGNIFLNSSSNGLFCSLPLENTKLENNLIKYSIAGAIVIRRQGEHGVFINDDHNIDIKKNFIIGCDYIGIEVNDSDDLFIEENIIKDCKGFPVYIYNSKNIHIKKNKMVNVVEPLLVDVNCDEIYIDENEIVSQKPNPSNHAIKVLESDNVELNNNDVKGDYNSEYVKVVDSMVNETGRKENGLSHKDVISNEVYY